MKEITTKDFEFLKELEALLYSRKEQMPEGSYTSKMYRKGIDKIAQKVGEEAVETIIAAKNDADNKTAAEAADLLFHLLLLLAQKNIPLHQVIKILRKRHKKGDHKHLGE